MIWSETHSLHCAFFKWNHTVELLHRFSILFLIFSTKLIVTTFSFHFLQSFLKITFALDALKICERSDYYSLSPFDSMCELLYVFCKPAHIWVNYVCSYDAIPWLVFSPMACFLPTALEIYYSPRTTESLLEVLMHSCECHYSNHSLTFFVCFERPLFKRYSARSMK